MKLWTSIFGSSSVSIDVMITFDPTSKNTKVMSLKDNLHPWANIESSDI